MRSESVTPLTDKPTQEYHLVNQFGGYERLARPFSAMPSVFYEWLEKLDEDFPLGAKHVAVILAIKFNQWDGGNAFPSQYTIARRARMSERTVRAVVNDLEEWGLVTVTDSEESRKKSKSGRPCNAYDFSGLWYALARFVDNGKEPRSINATLDELRDDAHSRAYERKQRKRARRRQADSGYEPVGVDPELQAFLRGSGDCPAPVSYEEYEAGCDPSYDADEDCPF